MLPAVLAATRRGSCRNLSYVLFTPWPGFTMTNVSPMSGLYKRRVFDHVIQPPPVVANFKRQRRLDLIVEADRHLMLLVGLQARRDALFRDRAGRAGRRVRPEVLVLEEGQSRRSRSAEIGLAR